MTVIRFTIHGKQATQGSKRGIPFRRKDGRHGVRVVSDNQQLKVWRTAVAEAAREAYDGPLLTGPIVMYVQFVMPRPKSHFGTGRNAGKLKPSAPAHHITKPDALKLCRAVEDALSGVIYRDDSQIVLHDIAKDYGDFYSTHVYISELDPT